MLVKVLIALCPLDGAAWDRGRYGAGVRYLAITGTGSRAMAWGDLQGDGTDPWRARLPPLPACFVSRPDHKAKLAVQKLGRQPETRLAADALTPVGP